MFGEEIGSLLSSNRNDIKIKDTVEIREKKRCMWARHVCSVTGLLTMNNKKNTPFFV